MSVDEAVDVLESFLHKQELYPMDVTEALGYLTACVVIGNDDIHTKDEVWDVLLGFEEDILEELAQSVIEAGGDPSQITKPEVLPEAKNAVKEIVSDIYEQFEEENFVNQFEIVPDYTSISMWSSGFVYGLMPALENLQIVNKAFFEEASEMLAPFILVSQLTDIETDTETEIHEFMNDKQMLNALFSQFDSRVQDLFSLFYEAKTKRLFES